MMEVIFEVKQQHVVKKMQHNDDFCLSEGHKPNDDNGYTMNCKQCTVQIKHAAGMLLKQSTSNVM